MKNKRLEKGVSLAKLENETMIKKQFITKIENNEWELLPDFAVVSGFVKNISLALNVDPHVSVPMLRRDYPPKKMMISPKPDLKDKFKFTPRLSFFLGVGLFLVLILSYLGVEYIKFISPPALSISSPSENETVFVSKLTVKGSTATDAIVTVNNQQAIVDKDGNFETVISVDNQTTELKFIATTRRGKKTEVVRSIKVDIN